MQVEQVQVFHKMPMRPQGTHGSYRKTIVENLYGSMLNRRLRELSQSREAPFLGAGASQGMIVPTREVYMIGAAVAPGGLKRGLETLLKESARIAQQGFTETEFEREKSSQLRSFERIYTEKATQPSEMFVEEFQRAFLENESVPGIDYEWALYQRFMPEITREEVNAVGSSWVSSDNRVVLVTAPESAADTLPSEEDLLALLDTAGTGELETYVDTVTNRPLLRVVPSGGAIIERKEYPDVGVTEWELGNGATVVLKPTNFRQDQVLFRAISPGGTSLADDKNHIAALSAVNMISASGYGSFSPREITNMLSDKVVDVSPRIDQLWEGFSGGASPRDLQKLFELLYLKFNFPRADSTTFGLITDQMRASFTNETKTPEEMLEEETRRTLTQNHFRRRSLSLEIIGEMDIDKSYDFYVDRFEDASDFTFVFVGNFDFETIEPLVRDYIGTLPSTSREETWADEGVRYPTGVIEKTIHAGLEPKSLTNIWFTGVPMDFADTGGDDEQSSSTLAMSAMATILEVRLRETLREDLGGTYGVRVGGRLTCLALLRLLEVFVVTGEGLHVHLPGNASRMRSPHDRFTPLGGRVSAGVVLHWLPLLRPLDTGDACVDVMDALVHAVLCQPARHAVATLDSALHRGLVGASDIAEIFAALPAKYGIVRDLLDGRAESGSETLMRLMVRATGATYELQVVMRGVGRVDLVVDGWLVIECDSEEFHSSWRQQLKD